MAERVVGNLAVVLEARTQAFEQQLARARDYTDRLKRATREGAQAQRDAGEATRFLGQQLRGLLPVLSAGSLVAFARSSVQLADSLTEQAAVVGLTVTSYSALADRAREAGLEQGQLSRALRTFASGSADAARGGLGPFREALATLKVDLRDAATGGVKPLRDLLPEVAGALLAVEDPMQRAGLSADLFGQRALDIVNVLPDLSQGFGRLEADARRAGTAIDERAASSLARFADAIDRTKALLGNFGVNLFGGALEELNPGTETLIERQIRDIQTLEAGVARIRRQAGTELAPGATSSRSSALERAQREAEILDPATLERLRTLEGQLESATFLLAEYQGQKLAASEGDRREIVSLDDLISRREAYLSTVEREREARRQLAELAREQEREQERASALIETLQQRAAAQEKATRQTLDAAALELEQTERLLAARRAGTEETVAATAAIEAENAVKRAGLELDTARGQQLYELTRQSSANREEIKRLDALEAKAKSVNEVIVLGTQSAMGSLTSTISSALLGAELSFERFAASVAATLTNLILEQLLLRAIVAPLFGALDLAGGGAAGVVASARGNVFRAGSVVPFARGGIIDRPVAFGLAGGRTGIAGEKGAEGVFPLVRTSSGDLGVRAVGGGGAVFAPQLTVNVTQAPDASAGETGARVAAEMRRELESTFRAMLRGEMRPGNLLAPIAR